MLNWWLDIRSQASQASPRGTSGVMDVVAWDALREKQWAGSRPLEIDRWARGGGRRMQVGGLTGITIRCVAARRQAWCVRSGAG